MNVAVHYGCHFVKPSKIKHLDDPERPQDPGRAGRGTGAKSVDYKDKQMCCGAGGGVRSRQPQLATEFTEEKLKNIKAAGGQYIIDVCPFCHLQFDRTQKELSRDTTSRSSTCPSSTVLLWECPRTSLAWTSRRSLGTFRAYEVSVNAFLQFLPFFISILWT